MNLAARNFRWYWRTHVAVVLGVAAASAALAGALLVGDSMRGSLREAALGRLGNISTAVVADRFFRAELSEDIQGNGKSARVGLVQPHWPHASAPIILLNGGVTHAGTQARVEHVQVLGVDERFWDVALGRTPTPRDPSPAESAQTAVITATLAADLQASSGDEIVLRIGKPSAISTETLLGRRDDTTRSLRLTISMIAPDAGPYAFSTTARQQAPRNAFVPLEVLQRLIEQPQRANAVVMTMARGAPESTQPPPGEPDPLLNQNLELTDYGLRLRVDASRGYVSLESERQLLEPAVEAAARTAAGELGAGTTDLLAYLANDIRVEPQTPRRAIPYSTVVGIGSPTETAATRPALESSIPSPAIGEVVLNSWAATTLGAALGDRITLDYFVTDEFGQTATRSARFTLRAIVPLAGPAADPGFVPDYPGVTDARSMTDWDPPFPVDFKRVQDADEKYWDEHRTTPKAFVNLEDAQRLWAEDAERLGRLTAIRFQAPDGAPLPEFATEIAAAIRKHLDPEQIGFSVIPLRQQATAAAAGNTDFGGLFIGFSFFLILSAALLVVLLFRLGVERRAKEIGLLAALGFSRRRLTRLLLIEGAIVAIVGTLLGLLLAPLYAAAMLAGLRSWWSDAVSTPFLRLHIARGTLELSAVAGVAIAMLSVAWSLRGVLRQSPRALLAGIGSGDRPTFARRSRVALWVCIATALAAIALMLASLFGKLPAAPVFFGSGALLVISALALLRHRLRSADHSRPIRNPGPRAWLRLGLRNAGRNPGRSLLTAGLIASASFLITALGAFRIDTAGDPHDRRSGAGGYPLFAEAAVPLPYDLNTPTGRDALGIVAAAEQTLSTVEFTPFRLRAGDAASCLNLYRGTRPRILGATDRFLERGGFAFSASLAETDAERGNPWLCLKRRFDDGAIPVIGDEAAVKWQLHSGLGQVLTIEDANGRSAELRFVALLSGSALQDELIVAEAEFLRLFPRTDGYAFFLIDAGDKAAAGDASVENTLERSLAPFAFDVASTAARIAAYNRVQNTYLATFQTLGGFGLILGTLGLAAVLLRNVWERRGELALLTAVGFSRTALGCVVLAENAALLFAGLLAGVLPALVAIAPQLAMRPEAVPWASLAATLAGVVAVGMAAGLVALMPVLRAPPLRALRAE